MSSPDPVRFADLNLPSYLLTALERVGYESVTPIQAQAIPVLLNGQDVLGNAPTGTGKTAAFALPALSRIDVNSASVQVLVLTPTRELAIQVAEAFQRYASAIKDFHVLPIYGGQEYGGQIRQLKRGVQVVVGTPGRVTDHLKKRTLRLNDLKYLVLDEADEMLRMGFIDEVEWILEQTPETRQTALFSATMPREIERIAQRHLREPEKVEVAARTASAETIRQRYWLVSGLHKLDALTRILEVEPFDAILMFVRTRMATTEIAERLEARGYAAAALSGDMLQKQREQTVERLKRGQIDILVATDVAARGLDVDRISHVVNYDIPYDTEAYIHRIGRTGRAGRTGEAILFVAPRERRMLAAIERATRQRIEALELPSTEHVNNHRVAMFKQKISDTLAAEDLSFLQGILEQYQSEHDIPPIEIAAALAKMSLGDKDFLLPPPRRKGSDNSSKKHRLKEDRQSDSSGAGRGADNRGKDRPAKSKRDAKGGDSGQPEMETFRLEVGSGHGVAASNIVGAVANEAGVDSEYIGKIDIHENHSFVDLPLGMPRAIFKDLYKAWVCGKQLRISRVRDEATPPARTDSALSDTRDQNRPRKFNKSAGSGDAEKSFKGGRSGKKIKSGKSGKSKKRSAAKVSKRSGD